MENTYTPKFKIKFKRNSTPFPKSAPKNKGLYQQMVAGNKVQYQSLSLKELEKAIGEVFYGNKNKK